MRILLGIRISSCANEVDSSKFCHVTHFSFEKFFGLSGKMVY